MQRREFIQGLAVGATALGCDELVAKDQPPPPIVDTHIHLWDLDRLRLPWLEANSPLNRNHLPREYQSAIEGLQVVKGVYMEVDVEPRLQVAEAEYVLGLCRQETAPFVGAVISGRPADEGFGAYLDRFQGNRHLKGVRQVLHSPATPAGFCLADNFIRGIRLLGERGLRYDLCMRPDELGDAVRLVEACPDVRFVLDHCGNGPVVVDNRTPSWRREMERLARLRNVICKVSGIVASAPEGWRAEDLAPVINHTLDTFGPDRVMFAGDWPVCTLRATFRQWVETLRTLVRNRSAEDQRKLFHDNAVRFYEL